MDNNPKYNPKIHHRRSIRLKGYDYAQAGLYFITICCQDMICRFGYVKNGKMVLNDAGKMVETWYDELENKYPNLKCHEMVVMPNHFHCIVEIIRGAHGPTQGAHVGAPLRGHPVLDDGHPVLDNGHPLDDGHPGYHKPDITDQNDESESQTDSKQPPLYGPENQKTNVPIGQMMDWFKTMTTNAYIRGVKNLGWSRFNGKLWQRDYYEHIIRNEPSYQRIAQYIINNPAKWEADKFYKS